MSRADLSAATIETAQEACIVFGSTAVFDFAEKALPLDHAARCALAFELFGRHGMRLLPHLDELSRRTCKPTLPPNTYFMLTLLRGEQHFSRREHDRHEEIVADRQIPWPIRFIENIRWCLIGPTR